MTHVEAMIDAAEATVKACEQILTGIERVRRDAAYVAKSMREDSAIPINQTGWEVGSALMELARVQMYDRDFNDAWAQAREDAVTAARAKRNAEEQG